MDRKFQTLRQSISSSMRDREGHFSVSAMAHHLRPKVLPLVDEDIFEESNEEDSEGEQTRKEQKRQKDQERKEQFDSNKTESERAQDGKQAKFIKAFKKHFQGLVKERKSVSEDKSMSIQ